MNKVLYIILISLFSLTIISCVKKDDSLSSTSSADSSSDSGSTDNSDSDSGSGSSATLNISSFVIDTTFPTVSSVAITDAEGIQNNILNAGDNVSVTATFSEVVIVDNSSSNPTITLAVGSDNRTATYASGDNSTDLVFRYTIQSGDIDTNGISIRENALDNNSSTISDLAGNIATDFTHSAVDNNSSYKVYATTFTVDNFTMSDTELKIGDNATVTLVFSEAVILFNSDDDITADNGSLSTMTSDDNRTWTGTFTPAINAEDDNNTLSLANNSYTDTAGNIGPAEKTANYEIDTLAPTVSSVLITGQDGGQNYFLNAGDNVSVSATFREAVIVDNSSSNPTITLAVGSDNRTATYTSGDNSTALVFRYTIQSGDTDTNGISIRENTLDNNSSTIMDRAGNIATDITHSVVDNNSSYKVDTTVPSVDNFTMSDTELKIGDNATVTLVFSEAVISFSRDRKSVV